MKYKYQLGYRKLPLSGNSFNTPYTDLPEFEAFGCYAFSLLKRLQNDFPGAEWRLVQCI